MPSQSGRREIQVESRDWYRGVSQGWQPYVSGMYMRDFAPQKLVYTVAVPVRGPGGKITGILGLQIPIEDLLHWLEGVKQDLGAAIYIVDPEGHLALHARTGGSQKIVSIPVPALINEMLLEKNIVRIGFDGVQPHRSIISLSSLPDYGWSVILATPVSSSIVLAARDTQLRMLLAGYGLIFMLSAISAALLFRVSLAHQKAQRDAHFATIVNTSTDAIISVDKGQRIILFNYGAEMIFGYSAAEMLGQTLDRLLPAQMAKEHRSHVQEFADSPELGRASRHMAEGRAISGRRKDGTEFPIEASIAKSTINGKVTLTAILRDMTERKQAENKINQFNAELEQRVIDRTAQLAAANKELESFSYSASHDLRTPLRSIDGFSQVLIEDYADVLDERAKDYLGRVRSATTRMGMLIDDMLALSRVTRTELRHDSVDLSWLAASVVEHLKHAEPQRKVECRIEPGLIATGDTRLLRVALDNLIGNAWKFTGKTKDARIEVGAIRNTDGETEFFVRDNGAGFDMRYVGKLFGAFQRLHGSDEFQGTGVGLATVQRIISRHGGKIRAESSLGRGATFFFTLNA